MLGRMHARSQTLNIPQVFPDCNDSCMGIESVSLARGPRSFWFGPNQFDGPSTLNRAMIKPSAC